MEDNLTPDLASTDGFGATAGRAQAEVSLAPKGKKELEPALGGDRSDFRLPEGLFGGGQP